MSVTFIMELFTAQMIIKDLKHNYLKSAGKIFGKSKRSETPDLGM